MPMARNQQGNWLSGGRSDQAILNGCTCRSLRYEIDRAQHAASSSAAFVSLIRLSPRIAESQDICCTSKPWGLGAQVPMDADVCESIQTGIPFADECAWHHDHNSGNRGNDPGWQWTCGGNAS